MGVFDELPDLLAEVFTDLKATEGLGFNVTITPAAGGGSTTVLALEDEVTKADLANGLVRATDRVLSIPAALLATAPATLDIVSDGTPRTVVLVETTKPGAAAAMYRVFLRAG